MSFIVSDALNSLDGLDFTENRCSPSEDESLWEQLSAEEIDESSDSFFLSQQDDLIDLCDDSEDFDCEAADFFESEPPSLEEFSETTEESALPRLYDLFSNSTKAALSNQSANRITLMQKGHDSSKKDFDKDELIHILEEIIVDKWLLYSEFGLLYLYLSGIWVFLSEEALLRHLRISLLSMQYPIWRFHLRDIKYLYSLIASNPKFYMPPDAPSRFNPNRNILNLDDGSYEILTDSFREQNPNDFCTWKLPLTSDELRFPHNSGHFDRFVATSLEGDLMLRQLLLEMIGLILSNQQAKVCLVFVGASNSGKSILVDFLRTLLGVDRIHQTQGLNKLSDRWTLGQLENKSLLLCTECEDRNISPESCSVLKTVSGEPILCGEKKGKDFRSFNNTTHILLVSNSMFHPEKKDQALTNRLVFLPFPVSIPPEQQNPNLLDDLLEDAGYIVREAMSALRGLINNNFQFAQPDPEYLEALESDSRDFSSSYSIEASIDRFVSDLCLLDADSKAEIALLYNAYVCFCYQQGMSVNISKKLFSQTLCRMIPDLVPNRYYFEQADGSKKQCHGILGIRLAQDENLAQDTF